MNDININYDEVITIEENALNWEYDKNTNIYKKVFSKDENKETSLIKIDKNSTFKNSQNTNSIEIFVLDGIYSNEYGDFPQGTYLKLPKEDESKISSKISCEVFKKTNYNQIKEEKIVVDTNTSFWSPGQGNLQVMPLSEQTALVKWPKNEVFIPHTHWGGEEILVLKGEFIDEHGTYKMGTWIRNPHLSNHHPYVKEETIILVKTGHM